METRSDKREASLLRSLPSIDRLLQTEAVQLLLATYPHDLVVEGLRGSLDSAREGIRHGEDPPSPPALVADARGRIGAAIQPTLRPVINATGVILHTNLGRAPLSDATIAAMEAVARGYSSLEYDLDAGGRGSRHEHVAALLRRTTGAEAGLVVNNNASGILLALAALATGKEVVISRGQLVEIGGGFRIPDVLRQSGAKLVEVGTTNRTYGEDYAAAIGDETALLLRVHASNFRVLGFTHSASIEDLVHLAKSRGLRVVDDLGSGSLLPTEEYGLAHEPMVQESVRVGADVVAFSGDKLLGGPQSGILVGRADVIERLRRHPLTRAVRPDKATLAGLRATLLHYVEGAAEREVPVWRMIATPTVDLDRRARSIVEALGSPNLDAVHTESAVGGGSTPGETLPSRAVAISSTGEGAQALATRLRRWSMPIIARVADDRVLLDLRTVSPSEDGEIVSALRTTCVV
ncbi:MAG: L-seryl-tRNA(Sec) selenium transferase [Chloroflexi bacterium]|nr:L-seryl-tRNA(Sec) selenium transferase [Chloroflexota bacterium]